MHADTERKEVREKSESKKESTPEVGVGSSNGVIRYVPCRRDLTGWMPDARPDATAYHCFSIPSTLSFTKRYFSSSLPLSIRDSRIMIPVYSANDRLFGRITWCAYLERRSFACGTRIIRLQVTRSNRITRLRTSIFSIPAF